MYAVQVAAVNYDISKEQIEEAANNLYEEAGAVLKAVFPMSDAYYCRDNHYAEFYLAMLRNYDVTTGQYWFEQVEIVDSKDFQD